MPETTKIIIIIIINNNIDNNNKEDGNNNNNKNDNEQTGILNTVKKFSDDINIDFGLEVCQSNLHRRKANHMAKRPA